jgi:hypothetical protein
MTPKQFAKFLERDGGCVHCGATEALAPNHRANRGMGGSKSRDVPSNIVVLCSWLNNAIEQDSSLALMARRYGWKLSSWQYPDRTPIFDNQQGKWFMLDDNFGRIVVTPKKESEWPA